MKESRKVVFLFRNRICLRLSLILLTALAALHCQSQSPGNAPAKPLEAPLDAKTSRNIEVTLRSKLSIPPDYVISVGPRSASTTPGFHSLLVSFDLPGHPEHSQKLTFLISDDNKTLERVAQWDISGDTADLVPAGDRPVRGNANAKVVLVNFDDLECPYCAKLHSELFPETLNHYKGLVKIVYRDLPIAELHPWAMHAAVDANCLAAQNTDAYWSYVDYLHTHGEDITGPDRDPKKSDAMLDKVASQQGEKNKLDAAKLSACVSKQDESGIREETKLSDKLNINQTPTLYINGEVIEGALPEDVLWQAIDRALVAEGVTPPPSPFNQPAKPAATAAAGQGAAKPEASAQAAKP